jgi:hypothetical protein
MSNLLIKKYPEIANLFDVSLNPDVDVKKLTFGSTKKVWWKCKMGPDHIWRASPNSLTGRKSSGNGCPFCRGFKVSVTNSLKSLFPEVAALWHPTKNADQTPANLTASSGKKVWWMCPKGPDHDFQSSPATMTRKQTINSAHKGCGFCSGQKASVTNSLKTLYPEISEQWHPTKNEGLTSAGVSAGSNKKVWWKCSKGSDHEWKMSVYHRTGSKQGCPFCSGRRPSVTNSLATLHPDLASEWDVTLNGNVTPEDVTAGSRVKRFWKCLRGPDHEWEATPNNRTSNKSGCPFCDGKRVSVTNSLATLYPELASEWHSELNGGVSPEEVTAGSKQKVFWICPKGHLPYSASLEKRTRNKGDGTGCPDCGKSGFKPSEPAILYYVRINLLDSPVYKIGITNSSIKNRFAGDYKHIKILGSWSYEVGRDAHAKEQEIINNFKDYLYQGEKLLLKAKNTEIFKSDVLGLDS